ncbi:hypothetical protein IV102_05375 [bacterium]|nr:hypothetical protein [bacterium]
MNPYDLEDQTLLYEEVVRELQGASGAQFFGVSRQYLETLSAAHVFLIDRERINELSEADVESIDEELSDDELRWPFPNLWLESTMETHEDPPRTITHGAHLFRFEHPMALNGDHVEAAYVEWMGLGNHQYQARQGLFVPRGESLSIARQAINTCPGCCAWSHERLLYDWMLQPYDYLGFHGGSHEADQRCSTYRIAIREGIWSALRAIAYINLPTLWTVRATPQMTSSERKAQKKATKLHHFFPYKKVRHLILDRHQLQELRNPDQTGARDVAPHMRRAHWRRLPEGYKKARTWVRESFVGDRNFGDVKNIYEVLN